MGAERVLGRKDELINEMYNLQVERKYSMVLLMLTDVLTAGTILLYLGDDETLSHAFDVSAKNNVCYLPKIISRKMQIVPMLSALWG